MLTRLRSFPASALLLLVLGLYLPGMVFAILGPPDPKIHDEYAYLLTADTFLHGRVTNPTHPMADHFEAYHVFHRPTYQAKYPPAQGAFLALGRLLGGEAIVGAWIGVALAAVALCWMLRAALSPGWALVGGMLPLFSFPIVLRWCHTYWGGGVAMLGGALLFGGILRLGRRLAVRDALAIGAGLIVLGNSRPLEGAAVTAVLIVPVVGLCIAWRRSGRSRELFLRFVVPVGLALLLLAGQTLAYNHALTGDARRLPHLHWSQVVKPASQDPEMRGYQGSPSTPLLARIKLVWWFFVGPFLTLAFLPLRRLLTDLRAVAALYVLLVVGMPVLLAARVWPYYLAPVAPLVFGIVAHGLATIARWCPGGRRLGLILAVTLTVLHLGYGTWQIVGNASRRAETEARNRRRHRYHNREDVERDLARHEGRFLVLVRTLPGHTFHRCYVYNGAEIDDARVVWAKDLGEVRNAKLLEYYSDRTPLLLEVRSRPRALRPYPR